MYAAEIEYHGGDLALSPEFATREDAEAYLLGQLNDSATFLGRVLRRGRPAGGWVSRWGYRWRWVQAELLFGGTVLRITDCSSGKAKLYQYSDRGTHCVLVGEDGEVHVVSAGRCDCKASVFRGGTEACRHRAALRELRLAQRRQANAEILRANA